MTYFFPFLLESDSDPNSDQIGRPKPPVIRVEPLFAVSVSASAARQKEEFEFSDHR